MLDNLDYLTVQKQEQDFPEHFHDTFCISLILEGVETIHVNGQNYYSERGCITITNPYEIHSNPMLDKNSILGFHTLYVSQDLMRFLMNGKNLVFINRKIKNTQANNLFFAILNAIARNDDSETQKLLGKFVSIIKNYSQDKKGAYSALDFSSLSNVKSYIDDHIEEKITLDDLAKVANINKYGFAKKFKFSIGMTPMNYVLMNKIFSCRKQITKYANLTHLALDYEFSDVAHFSKTFKRFVGVSPKKYKELFAIV